MSRVTAKGTCLDNGCDVSHFDPQFFLSFREFQKGAEGSQIQNQNRVTGFQVFHRQGPFFEVFHFGGQGHLVHGLYLFFHLADFGKVFFAFDLLNHFSDFSFSGTYFRLQFFGFIFLEIFFFIP